MQTQVTPKSLRTHIAIMGKRNVGKSSILNVITRQRAAIVSEVAGTTTDPVEKTMELFPLGPVVFIDTAGIDDESEIGSLRVDKSFNVLNRSDIVVVVTEGNSWGDYEKNLITTIKDRNIPVTVAINKVDLFYETKDITSWLEKNNIRYVKTSVISNEGIKELSQQIVDSAPADRFANSSLMNGLISPRDLVLMVGPLDMEAPVGRLKLPQSQLIRDCLDHNACCVTAKDTELDYLLSSLTNPPKMVICESHIIEAVANKVSEDIWLTTFSVLFARFKGDISVFIKGARKLSTLEKGDKVLIAEACTHSPIGEDIATAVLPMLINDMVGGEVVFEIRSGNDFSYSDLRKYKLIIHCGSCMLNRRELMSRIRAAQNMGIPITNYGLTIACIKGLLDRVIEPFTESRKLYTC